MKFLRVRAGQAEQLISLSCVWPRPDGACVHGNLGGIHLSFWATYPSESVSALAGSGMPLFPAISVDADEGRVVKI